jgi:anti-anti-sigma regulatory factor
MLKITLHDSAAELRFQLEGKLSGPWVGELQQCWHTAASTTEGRKTVLDLREVDYVDPEGQSLLAEMHGRDVRLVANTPLIRAMVDAICQTARCATVEEKPARRSDAFAFPDISGCDPRAV